MLKDGGQVSASLPASWLFDRAEALAKGEDPDGR